MPTEKRVAHEAPVLPDFRRLVRRSRREHFARNQNLQDRPVEIFAHEMVTHTRETFDSKNSIKLIGSEMTHLVEPVSSRQAPTRTTVPL